MKTLKELKGASHLGKKEQEAIVGGKINCRYDDLGHVTCPSGMECVNGFCVF
jgi:hypothetical protein